MMYATTAQHTELLRYFYARGLTQLLQCGNDGVQNSTLVAMEDFMSDCQVPFAAVTSIIKSLSHFESENTKTIATRVVSVWTKIEFWNRTLRIPQDVIWRLFDPSSAKRLSSLPSPRALPRSTSEHVPYEYDSDDMTLALAGLPIREERRCVSVVRYTQEPVSASQKNLVAERRHAKRRQQSTTRLILRRRQKQRKSPHSNPCRWSTRF